MTAHLSGTSHTVLFNSTLWKPDFMVVLLDLGPRWLPPPRLLPPPVPLNTTGPTTQLTSNGTHHTPRLGRASGRKNRLQAVLVGTQEKPQIKIIQLQSFTTPFISIYRKRWQVKRLRDSVESLAACSVDPPVRLTNRSGESNSLIAIGFWIENIGQTSKINTQICDQNIIIISKYQLP